MNDMSSQSWDVNSFNEYAKTYCKSDVSYYPMTNSCTFAVCESHDNEKCKDETSYDESTQSCIADRFRVWQWKNKPRITKDMRTNFKNTFDIPQGSWITNNKASSCFMDSVLVPLSHPWIDKWFDENIVSTYHKYEENDIMKKSYLAIIMFKQMMLYPKRIGNNQNIFPNSVDVIDDFMDKYGLVCYKKRTLFGGIKFGTADSFLLRNILSEKMAKIELPLTLSYSDDNIDPRVDIDFANNIPILMSEELESMMNWNRILFQFQMSGDEWRRLTYFTNLINGNTIKIIAQYKFDNVHFSRDISITLDLSKIPIGYPIIFQYSLARLKFKYRINISDFKNDQIKLFAITLHNGGAHWTCYIKSWKNSKWYYYDGLSDDHEYVEHDPNNNIFTNSQPLFWFVRI